MAETNGFPFPAAKTVGLTTEVKFLIDDDDIEGHRRCNGGEHGFEEIVFGDGRAK